MRETVVSRISSAPIPCPSVVSTSAAARRPGEGTGFHHVSRAARRDQEDGVREPAQQQDGRHEEGEVYRLAVAALDDYAEHRKGPHGGAAGRHGQPRRRAPWPRRPFAKTSGQMGPPAEASSTRGRATQPCWPERPSRTQRRPRTADREKRAARMARGVSRRQECGCLTPSQVMNATRNWDVANPVDASNDKSPPSRSHSSVPRQSLGCSRNEAR